VKRLEWELEARADLALIARYFSDTDPRIATLLIDRIEAAAAQLAKRDTGRPARMPKLREKSVARTSYIIAYRTFARRVVIVRVVHSAQNWPPGHFPDKR
jgi:plasmid stabilization system protein ParE